MIVRRPCQIESDIPRQEFKSFVGFREAKLRHGNAAGGVPGGLDVGEEGDDPVGGLVEPGGARIGGVADVPVAVRVGVSGIKTRWV